MKLDRFLLSPEMAEKSILEILQAKVKDLAIIHNIVDMIKTLSFGERYSHYINILGLIYAHERCQTGIIVECGVWKGGSSIGMILAQKLLWGEVLYPVYMFDSFMSMPEPSELDGPAATSWIDTEHFYPSKESGICYMSEVLDTIRKFEIEDSAYKIIQGYFEETLPNIKEILSEQKIVLLRLDSDWYESTKITLDYMMPFVIDDGLIIVDDYHWVDGCALAIHQYFGANNLAYRICNIREVTYFFKNNLKWF